jgi:hypothetical protein
MLGCRRSLDFSIPFVGDAGLDGVKQAMAQMLFAPLWMTQVQPNGTAGVNGAWDGVPLWPAGRPGPGRGLRCWPGKQTSPKGRGIVEFSRASGLVPASLCAVAAARRRCSHHNGRGAGAAAL